MVAPIIEDNRAAIAALCRTHRVKALWVFGSATTASFDPERSDIDVLIDLGEYDDQRHRRFFGLKRDLEALTGRPVDLLTVDAVENPYLREELERTRVAVYEREPLNATAI